MQDVIVIGAGLSGILTTLELANNYQILTVEAKDETDNEKENKNNILPEESSSYTECYKLHTGAHFLGDLATARHCLVRAVEFARKFPDSLAGTNLLSPWRRGRHFIMSNSLVSVAEAKNVVAQLQADYARLVAQDERNKVFGEPDNFIRYLENEEFSYIAEDIPFENSHHEKTHIHVALGIETAESQIDIDRFTDYLQQQIAQNSNIRVLGASEVTDIAYNPNNLSYLVTTQNKKTGQQIHEARAVVNCAWQNIEYLNKTLGVNYPDDEQRVVRIKASVLIDLPEALRKMNTCIFSSGPYASITVQPNGTAILTSERTTNVGFYNLNEPMPNDIKQTLENLSLKKKEGQNVAQKILSECAAYLSEEVREQFLASPIKELRVGFVKMILNKQQQYTQQSIYEANSSIHARLKDGVEEHGAGHISNAGMKMTYTASNAKTVAESLPKHFTLLDKMEKFISKTKHNLLAHHPHLANKPDCLNLIFYKLYRPMIEKMVREAAFETNEEFYMQSLSYKVLRKFESLVRQKCGFYSENRDVDPKRDVYPKIANDETESAQISPL